MDSGVRRPCDASDSRSPYWIDSLGKDHLRRMRGGLTQIWIFIAHAVTHALCGLCVLGGWLFGRMNHRGQRGHGGRRSTRFGSMACGSGLLEMAAHVANLIEAC